MRGCVMIALLIVAMLMTLVPANCAADDYRYVEFADMTPEAICASLTLEQKAAQMVMAACYNIDGFMMRYGCYGCVLSQGDLRDWQEWQAYIDGLQREAVASKAGVPFLYGQDDVHGVNYSLGAVMFPHNIGMGAANDEALMVEIGRITADEAKLCHMLWNYAPCVAQSADPRWGRTYESYGSDLERITRLSTAYTRGLVDGGIVACAKHFFADGNSAYGTGEDSDVDRLIDRGDARLTDEEIEALLDVYRAQIAAGAQTIMISHSSLNGVKMHENAPYIQRLKDEMGFEGFVASDWNSVQHTSPATYYEQVVTAVNAGIDMLMEVDTFDQARDIIARAVEAGDIPAERVDDAVTRILRVKQNVGLLDDPFCERMQTRQNETGSEEYRAVAQRAVEESLVLIKNEGNVLPLKAGTKVCVFGPAAQNDSAQCGGWSVGWNESPLEDIPGVTSILEGFQQVAQEQEIELVKDEADADVVVLVVGERAYAEWNGDAENIDLCSELGLVGNRQAIQRAANSGKPVVACIVAGRQVFIGDYIDGWDGVVMSYLPGSEGQGVANVLCGRADFTGSLPSPWYESVAQIEAGEPWLDVGFGLAYVN